MSFELVSQDLVPLDKKLARKFSNMRPSPSERTQKKGRMEYLYQKFINGLFHTPVWASCKVNGTLYRVNGHHSSKMLVALGPDFPVDMHAFVMEFEADSIEDLPDVFGQFDNSHSVRGTSDIIGAFAGLHEELCGIKSTILVRIVNGIGLCESEKLENTKKRRRRLDAEARGRLVPQNVQYILWASQVVDHKIFVKSGVSAALFRTWSTDTHFAEIFWNHVKNETHPLPDHPSRVLARFLASISGSKAQSVRYNTKAIYSKCIHAWNAARTKKNTNLNYVASAPTPVPK